MIQLLAKTLSALDRAELDRLALAAGVLLYVGHKASEHHPGLRTIGSRLAGLCFIVYAGHLVWGRRLVTDDVFEVVLRCVFVAGLALGAMWIIVPVVAWIMDCTFGVIWRLSLRLMIGFWHGVSGALRRCRQFPRNIAAKLRSFLGRKATIAQAMTFAEASKRRENLRAGCDMLYNLHAFALKERFPPEAYEHLKQRYLREDLAPTDFEARASQLCDIITRHASQIGTDPGQASIETLLVENQRKHDQIDSSNLNDDMKQSLNAAIDEQLEERVRKAVNK